MVIVRREHTNAEQKKSSRGAICITSTSPVERNNRMLVRVVYDETNLEVRVTWICIKKTRQMATGHEAKPFFFSVFQIICVGRAMRERFWELRLITHNTFPNIYFVYQIERTECWILNLYIVILQPHLLKKKSNRSLLFKLRDYLYNEGYRVPSRVSAARRSRASWSQHWYPKSYQIRAKIFGYAKVLLGFSENELSNRFRDV